jgi:hypothetical protein
MQIFIRIISRSEAKISEILSVFEQFEFNPVHFFDKEIGRFCSYSAVFLVIKIHGMINVKCISKAITINLNTIYRTEQFELLLKSGECLQTVLIDFKR